MTGFLALASSLIWWVLYASIGAIVPSAIAWVVLRWSEGVPVVFNRTYLACLIWSLFTLLLAALIAVHIGVTRAPFAPLIVSDAFRVSLIVSMLAGVMAVWRLVPRIDAHRIRIGSACIAVAISMAVCFGVLTTVAST